MKIGFKKSKALSKFMEVDWEDEINVWLAKVALAVQNKAKQLAPVDTWTLRRSITTDYSNIQQWYVRVGSPVPYARRRHFENYKNPQTLRYLERWYTEQKSTLDWILKTHFSWVI